MSETTGKEALHAVWERFPQYEASARELFEADEDFRELCSDYLDCLAVIERLRQGLKADDLRLMEYCETRIALEREISAIVLNRKEESDGGKAGFVLPRQ